jgi:Fe-S cluster assembly protein SufD
MSLLLDQNKFASCPKNAEESWKRTDPKIFFLPDSEVLNFQGQSALENKGKLLPWKICFRDFQNVKTYFTKLEAIIGKESVKLISEESHRLVLIDVTHGMANVFMSDDIKHQLEFMSTPWEALLSSKESAIGHALASRLRASSPHKIQITVAGHQQTTPLFIVLNHLNANYSQSYSNIHLNLKQNTKAELIFIDEGSHFSLFKQQLTLEEHSYLKQFWLNSSNIAANSSTFINRSVTLASTAKFEDAQLFIPKGTMKLNSHISLNGKLSTSESGGVVLANEGKFDYEPVQEHNAPESKSNLSLKMILDKKARSSFQGLVVANKEAQKCDARQENKNILLSKNCRVDSEPRLEILPHDITCKHGSATGEIDKKQMYYLKSRGISEQQAQQFILKGFAQSVFAFLEEESSFQKIVESTLANAFD